MARSLDEIFGTSSGKRRSLDDIFSSNTTPQNNGPNLRLLNDGDNGAPAIQNTIKPISLDENSYAAESPGISLPKINIPNLIKGTAFGMAKNSIMKGIEKYDPTSGIKQKIDEKFFPQIAQLNQDFKKEAETYQPQTKTEKVGYFLGDQIASLPAWLLGEGAVSGAAAKLVPKLALTSKAASVLPNIVKGGLKDAATYGAVVAPIETLGEGGNLNTLAEKEKSLPFVLGGGIALRGAGELAGKALNKITLPKLNTESKKVNLPELLENKNASTEKDINSFIDNSLSKVKQQSSLPIRNVTEDEAKIIKESTGLDVVGYSHNLTDNDIRHIIKRHGNAEEESKVGQAAITPEDIKKIPDIITNPDNIKLGSQINGRQSIIFQKQDNGHVSYVEVVVDSRKALDSKTMWKKPSARVDADTGVSPQPYVQDTNGMTSSNINSISQNSKKMNAIQDFTINNKINRATQTPIWEVKSTNKLTKLGKKELDIKMNNLGGFYSKTSGSYVFDKDPSTVLGIAKSEGKFKTTTDELLANSDNWNDKSMPLYNRETLERNLEDIAKDDAPRLIKEYIEPRQKNVAEMTRFLNTERTDIQKLAIKPRSFDSQLLMQYGEKKISLEELKAKTKNWENVVKANEVLRAKYNKYLEMANKVLERNGYDPIPKRDDYFMHFQEISDKLEMFGIPNNKLPTDINGLTADFTPGKTFFSSALRRTGDMTSYDAVQGIDKYLNGISKVIYLTDDIQRLRGLEKAIRNKYGEGSTQLSNFVTYLREYTNSLAGKKSMSDRGIESDFGRITYRVADILRRQVGANAVGGNVSSALTNFIPLTQSLATTNKSSFVKGMLQTMANTFRNDGFVDRSDFLTRRIGSDPLAVKLWSNRTDLSGGAKAVGNIGAIYNKVGQSSGWLFKTIDNFVSQVIVRGKYNEAISKGASPEMALKQANDWGTRIMADRSVGAQPNFFNKKGIMGALTQFQLEVNNQLSFIFKDIPKNSPSRLAAASATAQVFLYGYMFNSLFEMATGRRPAFDPIGVAVQAAKDYNNPELTGTEANTKLIDNIANQLPFSSLITSGGGRIPLTDSLPDVLAVANGTSTANKEFAKLPKLILPTGGGQLKKTVEGLSIFNNQVPGKYKESADGKQLVYPVAPTLQNKARGVLFGQYSFPEAREYYGNTRTPLSTTQTNIVEQMANKGTEPQKTYNLLIELKKLGTDLDAKKKEIDSDSSLTKQRKEFLKAKLAPKPLELKQIQSNTDLTQPEKNLLKKLLYDTKK